MSEPRGAARRPGPGARPPPFRARALRPADPVPSLITRSVLTTLVKRPNTDGSLDVERWLDRW